MIMVTCKVDNTSNTCRSRKVSSTFSGFRLLDTDQLDSTSNISRNSVYKLKIDSMFDDSRSVVSQRLDDRSGSCKTGSIIMYGKKDLDAGSAGTRNRKKIFSIPKTLMKDDEKQISNCVQDQIERLFTDVAKDATSFCFSVRCLGSMPLKEKVTSLQGLQDPLRQLYLSGAGQDTQQTGNLDISSNGLRIKLDSETEAQVTPFHNIAVWSAVKFVLSSSEGGAGFLPLITDPENVDKSALFRPLTAADRRRLSSGLQAPIFAIVMRASTIPRILECHGFVCQTAEDAIVIAATLYQTLMTHMSTRNTHNSKRRIPRNQNGVSCISIASSSALASSKYISRSPNRKDSYTKTCDTTATPVRPTRKKRSATNRRNEATREITETTTTEERKKKSTKSTKAPPVPNDKVINYSTNGSPRHNIPMSFLNKQNQSSKNNFISELLYHTTDGSAGDILTKVAIPRSGSFLNTTGLSRYKSRATRRNSAKSGGGGGSPLGFSELFNEFRLNENLHSLDEILNAIINADGMSFNDLKPIYKEFLLKLAVTLTKDELYQRSKHIMKRQKKRKLKRRSSTTQKSRTLILGAKHLKKVFWFGQFQSCKSSKSVKSIKPKQIVTQNDNKMSGNKGNHRTRIGTSGSDVSDTRNDHTFNGINRNSSSGYVSCSECSYESEACTCTSADRCYCSLNNGFVHGNDKLIKSRAQDSLDSCQMCYCSKLETNKDTSDTTWCDSDSCISSTKCYCKHNITRNDNTFVKKIRGKNEKFAVDYELFTVGGDGKSVRPQEALSVKKSVEVAALFSDVKLSQTTDIKSLGMEYLQSNTKRVKDSIRSVRKKQEKSSSASDILSNLDAIDKAVLRRNASHGDCSYQFMKAVSTSLEDSLGYLP